MIDEAIGYLRREVRDYLGVSDAEVILENAHVLKEANNAGGVYISLVNVEEEATLKNSEHFVRINNTIEYKEPAIFVNLYLLFSFEFGAYSTTLLRLSQTIERFQSKRLFNAAGASATNPFPAGLDKLIVDYHNLGFEQLNHLWGIQGGAYFPSLLYKIRLVKVQRDESAAGPEVTTIQIDALPQ
ncbi:MAG: DUF4255 domain-containing protein [Rhodothermia bacterium]